MMENVASLLERSTRLGKGLHKDCNFSHHPHALFSVRKIIMVLRLVNINNCPDADHLKLPRVLASGTATNRVGLALTISASSQIWYMDRA